MDAIFAVDICWNALAWYQDVSLIEWADSFHDRCPSFDRMTLRRFLLISSCQEYRTYKISDIRQLRWWQQYIY